MTLIGCLRMTPNEVDPRPVRDVEVKLKVKVDRLNIVMQAIMGWTATCPDGFRVGDAGWGVSHLNDLCNKFT